MINTNPSHLVNTVRVRVPKKAYKELKISGNNGNTLVRNLDVTINGSTKADGIKVTNKNISHIVNLESVSGDAILTGDKISAAYNLKVTSGDAWIYSDEIKDSDTMVCLSGDIYFDVSKVNGITSLNCGSGDIQAKVGTLNKNLSLEIGSGDGILNFKKEPVNLAYKGTNANDDWGDVSLPRGWKNGWQTGAGKWAV